MNADMNVTSLFMKPIIVIGDITPESRLISSIFAEILLIGGLVSEGMSPTCVGAAVEMLVLSKIDTKSASVKFRS